MIIHRPVVLTDYTLFLPLCTVPQDLLFNSPQLRKRILDLHGRTQQHKQIAPPVIEGCRGRTTRKGQSFLVHISPCFLSVPAVSVLVPVTLHPSQCAFPMREETRDIQLRGLECGHRGLLSRVRDRLQAAVRAGVLSRAEWEDLRRPADH